MFNDVVIQSSACVHSSYYALLRYIYYICVGPMVLFEDVFDDICDLCWAVVSNLDLYP